MSLALRTDALTKSYGRRTALAECTIEVPAGRVVGLVGPNGAGKSTLLNLTVGLLAPTTGAIAVLGDLPARGPEQLGRGGFVAQDTPRHSSPTVGGHPPRGARPHPGRDPA